MSSISHDPATVTPGRRRWSVRSLGSDVWASLAITAMWLTVLVDALFGPDIKTSDAGGSGAIIPSAVVMVFFAYLGTKAVARYGFGKRRDPD